MKNWRIVIIIAAIGIGMLLVLQIMLGSFAASAVQQLSPTKNPDEEVIFAARLEIEDFPKGWRADRAGLATIPGAEGRSFEFRGTNNPGLTWVLVTEWLYVFDDREAAHQGYLEQTAQRIPPQAADSWKHIPELDFAHHADEITVACLPGYINGKHHFACRAIARYQNAVVVILGNVFDDQWLVMSDFRAVLEAMDRRIVAALNGAEE